MSKTQAVEGDEKIVNTGRIRYRLLSRWFRPPLVVLQMEVQRQKYVWKSSRYFWDDISTRFRDTTFEDLTELDMKGDAPKPNTGDKDACFRPLKSFGSFVLILQIKDGTGFRDATVQDLLLRQYPTA